MSVDTEQMTEDRTSGVDSLSRAGNASSDEKTKSEEPYGIGCQKKDHGHETERLDS